MHTCIFSVCHRHGKTYLHKLVISLTSCWWSMPLWDWPRCKLLSIRGCWRRHQTASCCGVQSARTWWNGSRRDRATSRRARVGRIGRHTRSGLSTDVSARRRSMLFTVILSSRPSCRRCPVHHTASLVLAYFTNCRKFARCYLLVASEGQGEQAAVDVCSMLCMQSC